LGANVRRPNTSKITRSVSLVVVLLSSQLRPQSILLRLKKLVLLVQVVVQIALRSKVIDRVDPHGWTLDVSTSLVVECRPTARAPISSALRRLIAVSSLFASARILLLILTAAWLRRTASERGFGFGWRSLERCLLWIGREHKLFAAFVQLTSVCEELECTPYLPVDAIPCIVICWVAQIPLGVERLFHT
jgi:hypothetical protein